MSARMILLSCIFITIPKSNMAAGRCREICLSQERRRGCVRKVAPVQSYIRMHDFSVISYTFLFKINPFKSKRRWMNAWSSIGQQCLLQTEKKWMRCFPKGKCRQERSIFELKFHDGLLPFTVHSRQWTVSVAWPTGTGGGHWRPVWPWESSWGCSSAPGYPFSSPTWRR